MSKAYLALRAISKQVKGRARFGYPSGDMARAIIRAVPTIVVNAPQAIIGILDVRLNPGFVKRDFELETVIEPIPNYDSRVTLSSARDRLGLNKVEVDWQLTERDKLHFILLHKGTSKNTPSARPANQIQRISLNLTTGSGCDGAIGFL